MLKGRDPREIVGSAPDSQAGTWPVVANDSMARAQIVSRSSSRCSASMLARRFRIDSLSCFSCCEMGGDPWLGSGASLSSTATQVSPWFVLGLGFVRNDELRRR